MNVSDVSNANRPSILSTVGFSFVMQRCWQLLNTVLAVAEFHSRDRDCGEEVNLVFGRF